MKSPFSDNWYALFVLTGSEDKVKKRLDYRFQGELRIVVPKRKLRERRNGKWHNVIRTLFPGYVLLNGEMSVDNYYRLKRVPGLLGLLKSGYDPAPIDYWEMEVINRLICNNETVGYSNVLMENGKVVVVDGPLVSLEGQIISVNLRKCRAKVSLTFMGEPRVVELGINMLQPA
jgi:transcriptional antiterminator NusG